MLKKIHNTDSIGWYIFYYEEKDYKSAYEFNKNMIEEIQELVSKYPEHFKTKYYREKMEEITNNAPECVVYTLQTFLQNQSCHRQVTI